MVKHLDTASPLQSGCNQVREMLHDKSGDDRHDWIPYIEPTEGDRKEVAALPKATVADRIRATVRHPQYWKDLSAYLSKNKRKKSRSQSKTPLFWEPDSPIADKWNLPATIVDRQHSERLLEYYKKRPWRSSDPIRVLGIQPRFILLSVDLSETAVRLKHVFGKLVEFYQEDLGWDQPRRNRELKCDPFEIYDLIEIEELNYSEATRKIFGTRFTTEKGPAYSNKAKKMHEQTKRAYKWAKDLISQIGKEAGN